MITTTFNTARKLASFLNKYAKAMDLAFDTNLISNDMRYYANEVLDYANSMRVEGAFSYRTTLFIRSRGVESSQTRVRDLNDFIVCVINFRYDSSKKTYTVTIE